MLASRGSYFGQRSFDLDPVHGSFRDYFWAMSRQTYDPTVTVLNNPDANGYPIWVTLSGNKTSYGFSSFISAAKTAATAAGYNVTPSTSVRVCYIYAGRWCVGIDVATTLNGPEMAVPERDPSNRAPGEASNAKLGHIGYYCHEFVHMMGAAHTDSWAWYWCLMRSGHKNGDAGEESANCPAPMNPWLLYKAGWASPITLNNDLPDAALIYSTEPTSPSTYYVRLFPGSIPANDERLLVENRQLTNNYDQQLPPLRVTPPKSGGILIWRIRGDGLNENQTQLILADKDPGTAMENQAEDVFRPDGTYPYHKIFDHSSPATLKLSDSTLSHLVVDDYFTNGNTINIDFQVNYLSSKSSTATAYNSSRKLVRDSGSNYHLIYEAEGEINYQYSADGGNSWSRTKRLSSTFGNNKYPSITERSGKLYVIWQRYDGSSYDIYFRKSTDGGSTWGSASQIASNVGTSDPLPVIASPATNELMAVYRSGNNLNWKRSTNDGSSWPTSGTISAGTGEVLNSPSITATRLPWSSNVTGLAYATKEIPNASHIIARYYNAGVWSAANNISSSLPGNLSQHAHPSVSHSGTSTADYQHVAWDAYSSYCQSRVIIHRKGTTWAFGSQYWELHYQEEDRPSISGLTGNTAHIAYQRGTACHFTAHFDGTGWSVQFPPISGFHPSFSMGNTSAKYVWTSGSSSSPYTINVSSTTFSKPVVNDSLQVVYQRSVAVVDTVTGGWLDVRLEQMTMKTSSLTSDNISFMDIPSSLNITPADGFSALASQPTFVPTMAESLIVCYLIGGENLSAVKNPAKSVGVELQIVTTNGSTLSIPVYTTNSDMIGKQPMKVAVAAAAYVGKEITIKTQVSGIASKSVLVASIGHIYQMVDTKKDAPPIYATIVTPPENCKLQAYPNPFNPNTEILFALIEAGLVTVRIYNIQGQLVKEILNQYCPAGRQTVQWDGKNTQGNDLASGIYVCQIKAGSLVATQKLTLIR